MTLRLHTTGRVCIKPLSDVAVRFQRCEIQSTSFPTPDSSASVTTRLLIDPSVGTRLAKRNTSMDSKPTADSAMAVDPRHLPNPPRLGHEQTVAPSFGSRRAGPARAECPISKASARRRASFSASSYSVAAMICLGLLSLLLGCSGGGSDSVSSSGSGDSALRPLPPPTATRSRLDAQPSRTPPAGECCVPVGFDDDDPESERDRNGILVALFFVDSDGDGESDGHEIVRGSDPTDPTDGDADGDGLENRVDPDVDGDGVPNGADGDIDGDGVDNAEDHDADGDGVANDADDDADGDGIANNDGDDDGEPDDEEDCDCKHGECHPVTGKCICEPGWEGESCETFHCKDVNNCNNGRCIGPNTCGCNPGWESRAGSACAAFHCRDLARCNDNGECVGPNSCSCDDDWKGTPDCRQRTCVLVPSLCDDGNPCTIDDCDAATGCSHEPMICSLFESCVAGDCVPSCNTTRECEEGQACRQGGCVNGCEGDTDCLDGDSCTIDECDTRQSCQHEPVPCSILEECVRGACVVGCATGSDCEEGEACFENGCFAECESDSDCDADAGETCDPDEAVCLPNGEGEEKPSASEAAAS